MNNFPNNNINSNKHSDVNKVAKLGIFGNILLLLAKLLVGFFSNSQSMIADGLNSAGDVFSSIMTFIGNKISSKPKDENHPYGHGKAEYIFSMIISFSLILIAVTIFRSSFNSLITKSKFQFSPWLIFVAIGTIIIKFLLYLIASKIGKEHKSLLAIANAEDHRNDIFISSLTLISVVTGYFNIQIIDGIVGILISFWIAYTGYQIFANSYIVLMDTNIDENILNVMELAVKKIHGVDHIDSIHAQPIGLHFLLIVKVSIDASLTVYEGHEISGKVKRTLLEFDDIADVIVHVNPA